MERWGAARTGRVTRHHGPAGPLAAFLAVAMLVAGCAGPAPSLPPVPSSTALPSSLVDATASSNPITSPVGSPSPSASPAWTAIAIASLPLVATLEPTKSGDAGVAPDTAFRLTSLDGRPAALLAAHLVASPAIAFAIDASGATAVLRPTAPLAVATAYRISLTGADGTVEASWSAQTAAPLRVSYSIPGDEATRVPVDTGIEVTFNQSGVTAAAFATHFTIRPAVAGRFQLNGRAGVFVPDRPLAKGRVYTVTITRGLSLAGAGQALGQDAVIRFETSTGAATSTRVSPMHPLVDASPRERAAVSLDILTPDNVTAPTSVPVTVHRLAGFAAAMAAYDAIVRAPTWAEADTTEFVPTTRLTLVASARIAVRHDTWVPFVILPRALPTGWYVVTIRYAGLPRQTVLQVTDTATYALVTSTRTLVWVNDLRSKGAVTGASVTVGGNALGATDRRGIAIGQTPVALRTGRATSAMVVVRTGGGAIFRPVELLGGCADCATGPNDPGVVRTDRWWTFLAVDRSRYRATDTVHAYGIVRDRATGDAPASVRVTVTPSDADPSLAPITSLLVSPDARGMYAATVPLTDLPVGSYRLRVLAGASLVGEAWFDVGTIRKPAYSLSVITDRHAVITGASIVATVGARFFDTTPVAGVDLEVAAPTDGMDTSVAPGPATTRTGLDGTATDTIPVRLSADDGQWTLRDVWARPTLPEEADLSAAAPVAVFRASAIVTGQATATSSRVTITGSVNSVAFGRFEAAGPSADLSLIDPAGAGRPGVSVLVAVTAVIPYRTQTGTAYDVVTKRVSPVYAWHERRIVLPARTVLTDASGSFRLSIAGRRGASWYDIGASYNDEAGRRTTASIGASVADVQTDNNPASLEDGTPNGASDYSVGQTIRLHFAGGMANPPVSRYLYAVTNVGLRSATVSTSGVFVRTFTAADVPSIRVRAVRFTGLGYEMAMEPYLAGLRLDDRRMPVTVTADKTRYTPGSTAGVTIRTLDPAGRPVAASVFVRAIDQKLFAIGGATDDDPVWPLYENLDEGVVGTAASHGTPHDDLGGGQGDATGGGGGDAGSSRDDFRDWLVGRVVRTGNDGLATLSIPLSDDLTSWHVAVTAVDARLDAGAGSALLAVGLPFFVDATLAPEYLVTDHPVIRLRSFGTALQAGAKVTFTVRSDTLAMPATTATADAFGTVEVPLPALAVGTQTLGISATTGAGTAALSDAMVRTFSVVATRATQRRVTWSLLTSVVTPSAGTGLTSITLADAGRGRVLPLLQRVAGEGTVRSDLVLAAEVARRVLADRFGMDQGDVPNSDALAPFLAADGVTVVPWGSASLEATVLAAMASDPRLAGADLVTPLEAAAYGTTETREWRLFALAGLAALGRPVLADIRAVARSTDLTTDEQVNLALAALFAGDETLAATLEHDALARAGSRHASQVRLLPTGDVEPAVLTARLEIVAASLGEPIAADMDAYVEANPPATTLVDLERALAARGWASRIPGATAEAALTVDGKRTGMTIIPGASVTLTLTAAQAADAQIEPVGGSVLVIQAWDAVLSASSLTPADGASMRRTVEPAGTVTETDVVVVTLDVTIPYNAGDGCWSLVEIAPSGLAPVDPSGMDRSAESGIVLPVAVDGQRVTFCLGPDKNQTDFRLRWAARVITPGTYTWEPAVLQSPVDPTVGVVLPPGTLTIAGVGG